MSNEELRPRKKVFSGYCNVDCTKWILFHRGYAEFTGSYRGGGVEVLLASRVRGQVESSMVDYTERVAEIGVDGVRRQEEQRKQRPVQYFIPETSIESMHVGWSGSASV